MNVDCFGVQILVVLSAVTSTNAVNRPIVYEVWVGACSSKVSTVVVSGIVPVARCDHKRVVISVLGQVFGDCRCNRGTALASQRAALAEVILDVDNQ
jgi:hypothetical protein